MPYSPPVLLLSLALHKTSHSCPSQTYTLPMSQHPFYPSPLLNSPSFPCSHTIHSKAASPYPSTGTDPSAVPGLLPHKCLADYSNDNMPGTALSSLFPALYTEQVPSFSPRNIQIASRN